MEPLPDSNTSTSPPAPAPTVPRACDPCRTRKIRCDREVPCSHCKQAKIECSINLESRPKEKRAARILVTPQYEKKIDHIDRRLEVVVRLLQDLKAQLPTPSSSSHVPSPDPAALPPIKVTPPFASPACSSPWHEAPEASVVEGDSSLMAHSTFAKDMLHKVVDRLEDPSRLMMGDTLDALRHLVDAMKQQPASHEMSYPNVQSPTVLASSIVGRLELPPIEKAVQLLQFTKSDAASPVSWFYEAFPVHTFPETCMRVYFTKDYTFSDYIIVNTGLHALFWLCDHLAPSTDTGEYQRFSLMCGKNIEAALANLPLHMPTDADSIAIYAIELSKPSLAWILTSKGSELCQTLGYHRIDTYKSETAESAQHKQFLFWGIYALSQALCLRLGRCSTIQDYDITIPYPSSDIPQRQTLCGFTTLWVREAKLQGEIYERLYCPNAIVQPESIRRSRVQALVQSSKELESFASRVIDEYNGLCRETVGDTLIRFVNKADKVLRLSLLCTIHRAVPNPPEAGTTFSNDCIAAARASLDEHHACMNLNDAEKLGLFSTYMHWTILFSPFVPFITLFVNVIETLNRNDLGRLRAFLDSIRTSEAAPETEAVVKTRRLFQVLYNVALHYVDNTGRSNPPAVGSVNQVEQDGIDTYLATLGFVSQGMADQHQHQEGHMGTNGDESQTTRGVDPMLWMGTGTQLEDWFYSNQQMMDLEFALDGGEEERF